MKDIVEQLRAPDGNRRLLDEAADRIEALEAELKLTKEHLNEGGRIILANVAHSEALEAALREIKDQYLTPDQSSAIAKAALAHV